MRILWIATFFCLTVLPVHASELRLYPSEIPLNGPKATQQLLVVDEQNGQTVADHSKTATFMSSNPNVAVVEEGIVKAIGDGKAVITAQTADGKSASAKVVVSHAMDAPAPNFRNHVIPLFTRAGCNSGACHGALAGKGGLKLSLRGYDPDSDHHVLTRQALARRVDGSDPAKSLILLKPTRTMPHGGGRRFEKDDSDYQVILDWIKAGAHAPQASDPRLDRIEVLPHASLLSLKSEVSMIVRAWYSDGRVEDVTRWSRFGCSDEDVAKITEEGRVTVAGNGEASITVGFGSRVATATITAPYANKIADSVYAGSPRYNSIDEFVLKKLRVLSLLPSAQCTDSEFIRRASIDAAGILPTPEEVEKFIANGRSDKRSVLIDQLLERSEFVDYWAYKWSDLLLVSTRKLPKQAMWSFYRSIRQSVADNKPWDQFAREIITASGGTLHNGGANFFILHKDTAELTESVAVTFMGMSITCARCHNHPLEKWTQDQYWSMANLFSRVGLKNSDRSGEVVVFEKQTGDVLHPRRNVPMPPTPLDGKPLALDDSHERRAYFADWLTAKQNPYFAKAIVNRVWRNFMGRGLVEAEDDLRETNPPSNRELLDALVADFVEHNYDVKHLIRQIMNSAAYQRSSKKEEANKDDNRFYSRYIVRRLSGEVLLDCLSQVTATPTNFDQVYTGVEGGVAATTDYPAGTRALQLPDSRVASKFLDAFGRPDRIAPCACERQQDTTVGQALMMNNGQVLNDKLRAKTSRINEWLTAKVDDDSAVKRVFLLALGRSPTADELKKCIAFFKDAPLDKPDLRREAMEDLFWAVLTSREFIFNH